MSVFRIIKDKDNPYVMVNKGFVYDPSLTWKAKGILLYLLSRPDNWQVYEREIITHSISGRDSVRSGIKELINKGYIHRYRLRDNMGQLRNYEYAVYESPVKSIPESKNGFSNVGKSDTTNNNITNTQKSLNKYLKNKRNPRNGTLRK